MSGWIWLNGTSYNSAVKPAPSDSEYHLPFNGAGFRHCAWASHIRPTAQSGKLRNRLIASWTWTPVLRNYRNPRTQECCIHREIERCTKLDNKVYAGGESVDHRSRGTGG